MRRADIKPGTMYAKHSNWGPPSPVVLLTSEPHFINRFDHSRSKAAAGMEMGGRRNYTGSAGYPALVLSRTGADISWEDRLAAMEAADPEAELARWLAKEQPACEGLSFELITSLTGINGGYRDEHATYIKARKAAARARNEAEQARRQDEARAEAALAMLRDAVASLTGRDDALKAWKTSRDHVVLYTADAELIAGLLTEHHPAGLNHPRQEERS